MKGTVITVDFKSGEAIIGGDDRVSYGFGPADWKENLPPVEGQRVDFVPTSGSRATEVHVEVGARTNPISARASPGAGAVEQHPVSPRTPAAPKSLWEQWSFLVTVGLCILWITEGVSSVRTADSEMLLGGLMLAVITVLAYLGYRKLRGWKVIPHNEPGAAAPSPRRIGALALSGLLIAAVGIGAGSNAQPRTSGQGSPRAEPYGGFDPDDFEMLTCGEFLEMSPKMQRGFAEMDLAESVRTAETEFQKANIATWSVDDVLGQDIKVCQVGPPSYRIGYPLEDP